MELLPNEQERVVKFIAENLWTLQYPLTMLGVHVNRTVTLIRLSSGKLVIPSTALFRPKTWRPSKRHFGQALHEAGFWSAQNG
jgi:hypothetical protein